MRRLVTTAALAVALTAGGAAAPAQAAPAVHSATSATRVAAPAGDGSLTLAAGTTLSEHQLAQEPSKRRYRTKTKRRGFLSRIFGFLGFLLCLPFVLVLVIALVMMMRRSARRRDEQMNAQRSQYPQQTPYGEQPPSDRNTPSGR